MAGNISVSLGSPTTAVTELDAICTLYDRVFSQPPFKWSDDESQHHRESLTVLRHETSFGISVAHAKGTLAGFAYGFALSQETRWWQDFLEKPPDQTAMEWPGRTFALIDLAVDEEWRGRGLGRELTETLLASRSEQRATLCVQPAAIDTQGFYVHLGWRKVGRKRMPPGAVSPLFDVYVTDL